METQQKNIRSWDDLIFENRNKAYGAYAIRQSYQEGVFKGILTSTGIIVAVFILAVFFNGKSILPPLPKGPIVEPGSVPYIKRDLPKEQPRTEPQQNTRRDLTPVAVVNNPDSVANQPESTPASTGTEGTGNGPVSSDTGTGGVPEGTVTEAIEKPNQVFTHVEVMPSYRGGYEKMMKTLSRNMKYPASARRTGKEGTAYVEFVVDNEGNIQDVKVLRGFDMACDKEALRIVSLLTEWNPGLQNQLAVNVKLVLPIKFKLEQ
jgi:protein TonB